MFLANAVASAGGYVSNAFWGTGATASPPTENKDGKEAEAAKSPVTVQQLKEFALASTKKMPEWAPSFAEIASKLTTENEKVTAVQAELEKQYGTVWQSLSIDPKIGSHALATAGDILDAEDNDEVADSCQDALDDLSTAMKDAVGNAILGKEKMDQAKAQVQQAQRQAQEAQQNLSARLSRMTPTQKKLFLKNVTAGGLAITKQGAALSPQQQQTFIAQLPQDKKDTYVNYHLCCKMGLIKPPE